MKYVADLHIHSHYSRATSKNLNLENLYKWAQIKGITVIGTGDLTHPAWLEEMKEKLEPAEDGLFRLKSEFVKTIEDEIPKACKAEVRFLLSGEISSIYKKNERVRKNHNVVFLPSFHHAEKFQATLEQIGNIRSDGRPILGLDARNLLEMVLENSDQSHLIPAHIWTPWFSMLGSKSGFDTVEECFEDLTNHIFAVETGLSSDPPMNWRLSMLDKYTLVSNSDAHSPQKLAREANLFDAELSYNELFNALQTSDHNKFKGTLEFFPEEGKYHFDGHRKCDVNWHPRETLEHNCICSECGKPVTVGVMHRINELADRKEGYKPENAHPFYSIVPLPEIIAEIEQVGVNSKRVQEKYFSILNNLGSELKILQDVPLEDIEKSSGSLIAEGIRRTRSGELNLIGGYDGEFGTIKLFNEAERKKFSSQMAFFAADVQDNKKAKPEKTSSTDLNSLLKKSKESKQKKESVINTPDEKTFSLLDELNEEQKKAVTCTKNHLVISAGPGTGKTKTLIHRIAYLISEKNISPENILAITFTNKAASEMLTRLKNFAKLQTPEKVFVKTFHSLCTFILRKEANHISLSENFIILSEQEKRIFFKELYPKLSESQINKLLDAISETKNNLEESANFNNDNNLLDFENVYELYNRGLLKRNLLDFDDLILKTVKLFESNSEVLKRYQNKFKWISVDEYQDINYAQYKLLKLLVGSGSNLCAIGDPDQAIYGFRGADNKYFLNFTSDFSNSIELKLLRNYRSASNILGASLQVINKNKEKDTTNLLTEIVSRTKIEIHKSPTYKAEAEFIVKTIEEMIGGTSNFSMNSGRTNNTEESNYSFSDFAVLYRLNALTPALEEAIDRSGIPYQIAGTNSFYESQEISEIINYLKFILQPENAVIEKKYNARFKRISKSFNEIDRAISVKNCVAEINRLIEEDIKKPRNKKQQKNIDRFILSTIKFGNDYNRFLEAVSLSTETDEYNFQADKVSFLTLHASKGLEFSVVFIIGCEDELIPYKKNEEEFNLDEERRLFYVGMTRAKEKLILSHTSSRFLFGKNYDVKLSPFLRDISNSLIELKKSDLKKKSEKYIDEKMQLNLF